MSVENAGTSPRDGQFSRGSPGAGLAEARVVWALFGVVAVIVVITYSRIAPHELYHVSHSGLAGGLGRALVFLNYPTALAALAILAVIIDRAGVTPPAMISAALCLVILVPGVVDEGDLDAKWINVVPATGVVLAFVLTLRARDFTWGDPRGDPIRIAVAAALTILALPWISAELGFYLPGPVFLADDPYHGTATVHLGEHHGFESLLLIVTALLLSRQLSRMRHPTPLAVYLSLLIAYGLGNIANDAWKEQVVKRGWTSWEIPSVLRPGFTWMWGLILVAGLAIFFTAFQPRHDDAANHPPPGRP
jgi:hypothetical protein